MPYQTIVLTNKPYLCGIEIACTKHAEAPEDATSVVLRRRISGSGAYTDIATITITTPDNLTFTCTDYNVVTGTSYDYLAVPYVGETEGTGVGATVACSFDAVYISDTTGAWIAGLDVKVECQKNLTVEYQKTLAGVYPHRINNTANNYMSGTVTGLFVPIVANALSWTTAAAYKRSLLEMLCNGQNKTLKTHQGDIWTVGINGNPKIDQNDTFAAATITFEWTEVAAAPTTGVVMAT